MAISALQALSCLVLAGSAVAVAAGSSQLTFQGGGNSISVSYDGTDLTVPGYARSSELTSLANTVSALGTRVGNIEALLANNSLSITANEAGIIKNAGQATAGASADYGFTPTEEAALAPFFAATGIPNLQYFTAVPGNEILLAGTSGSELSSANAAALAAIFSKVPGITITKLDLEMQKMGEAELTAIFHGLDSAASSAGTSSLPLEYLNVAHTDMGDTATIALTDFLKTASLPNLDTVNVMFNDIQETGGLALAAALNEAGAMPALTKFIGQSQDTGVPGWIGYNNYHTCMGTTYYPSTFGLACAPCDSFCAGGNCNTGFPAGYPCGPARGAIANACFVRQPQLIQCGN